MRRVLVIPLLLFVMLLVLLAVGLKRDPRLIPSPLIGKPAPAFALPRLDAGERRFAPAELQGKVWLLNVWASWCGACRDEHADLLSYARGAHVPLIGLDYKDDPRNARAWLGQYGNPYDVVALDADGRVGIDYGVYGVPETFVIDANGRIAHKHTGPLTAQVIADEIEPVLRRLSR